MASARNRAADRFQASLLLCDTCWIRGDRGFSMAFRSCVGLIFDVRKCSTAHRFRTGALSLTNGGAAGAIWVFFAVAIGMFSVVVSMAEMASM